jgi:DNA-binding MarR family transcriptional regulator
MQPTGAEPTRAAFERARIADELNQQVMRFVRLLKSAPPGDAGPDRTALLLLWPLMHGGPMRVRDLAEAKGVDASTISRQVAQLVEAGLVRREPDPADRRAWLLALTDGGQGACRHMIDARRRAIAEALHEWDPDQVRHFTELFREFNLAVERHQAGGRSTAPTWPAPPASDRASHTPPAAARASHTPPASERASQTPPAARARETM